MAQMQFVDAQRAGEMLECPLPSAGRLVWRTFQSRQSYRKPSDNSRRKSRWSAWLQTVEAHAIVEKPVDDGLADAIGVLGRGSMPGICERKVSAARAAGAVFSHDQFDDQDRAVGEVGIRRYGCPCVGRVGHSVDTERSWAHIVGESRERS